jgi:rfaE bifunctional protein nucleotidyltransferase chain/domain
VVARRLAARAMRTRRGDLAFVEGIAGAGLVVSEVLAAGGTVFAAGNGGSATQCQHLTSELVGRFRRDRPGMRAVSLTGESAVLTSVSNDYGFEQVFARQIEAMAASGDLLIVFSTSGRSSNVVSAAELAQERGLTVVGMTANGGDSLAEYCDLVVNAPPGSTASIQEHHLVAVHLICEIVESEVLGVEYGPEAVVGLVDLASAVEQRERWRVEGRTVAWTNGCFDLFHKGHLSVIEAAAREADALIVGVNSDDSVRRLKGAGRPVVPLIERVAILSALRSVDLVVVLDEDEPSMYLERLVPDLFLKGGDYVVGEKPIPERAIVEAYGGRVLFSPVVDGVSTSKRIHHNDNG